MIRTMMIVEEWLFWKSGGLGRVLTPSVDVLHVDALQRSPDAKHSSLLPLPLSPP